MTISVRKNKDGSRSFRARVKSPVGSWMKSNWVRNLDEAKQQEASLLEERRLGGSGWTLQDGKTYTVNQYWEVWSEHNRTKVSEGWKITQNQMWRDYIAPVIGNLRMAQVQSPEIGQILNRMRDLGRSEQTIDNVYTMLRKMFGDAMGYYKMIRDIPVSSQFHRPEVLEVESAFLQPEQVWTLLSQAQNEPAVWLEALAGLRTEATVALMWDCVFLDTAQILIRRAFKQKVRRIEEYPKGKKWVYVPIVPPLWSYLVDLGTHGTHGFVCKGPKGGMLAPETYGPRLKKHCRSAGLPEVSPHILRHSCTELFAREGAGEEDIKRLLNHKNSKTTQRYMHRTDERLQRIAGLVKRPELQVIEGGGYPRRYPHGKLSAYVEESECSKAVEGLDNLNGAAGRT